MTDIKKAIAKMKGWRVLIQETNEKLQALNDPRLKFFSYQKYETLRYNTGIYSSDTIEKIIDEAEDKSEHICIACSAVKYDPEQVLCSACLIKFKREEYEQ